MHKLIPAHHPVEYTYVYQSRGGAQGVLAAIHQVNHMKNEKPFSLDRPCDAVTGKVDKCCILRAAKACSPRKAILMLLQERNVGDFGS